MDLKYKYYIKKIDGEWQILPVSKITSSDGGMYEIEYVYENSPTVVITHHKYLFEDEGIASLIVDILNNYEYTTDKVKYLENELSEIETNVEFNTDTINGMQDDLKSISYDLSDLRDEIEDLKLKIAE